MANRDKAPASPLVLIANDQEWSARSIESILGPNGYSVVRAYTGQQALERARTSQPDIIILDAQMPDMHGFEVCRALRSDPRLSVTTPIVITTSGPSGRTQRLEAYRCGAWEFLGQPLDGEALLLKLATFLQSKQQVDVLREENLLDSGTGLYNMRGLARRAKEIGADEVIVTSEQDYVGEVKRLTGKAGADVILDHLGGELLEKAVAAAARKNEVVNRRLEQLREACLPMGKQQERILSSLHFPGKYGLEFTDRYWEQMELDAAHLQVIVP